MIVTRTKDGHLLGVSTDDGHGSVGNAAAWVVDHKLPFPAVCSVEPDPDSGGFRLVPL